MEHAQCISLKPLTCHVTWTTVDGHAAVCKVRSSLLPGQSDTLQWPSSRNYERSELGRRWENKQHRPPVRPSVCHKVITAFNLRTWSLNFPCLYRHDL